MFVTPASSPGQSHSVKPAHPDFRLIMSTSLPVQTLIHGERLRMCDVLILQDSHSMILFEVFEAGLQYVLHKWAKKNSKCFKPRTPKYADGIGPPS